ncbi:hypothetical protein Tsubulata_008355 [Turnera subulata]|uniref:Uncharacterized protein n=1 Tax=Turnera subulata TaxID=218843 RepID=A0A9Q0FVF2_9ROSI|nr:hypothetical protein Tsubulata_008355 [Turnera subulata]
MPICQAQSHCSQWARTYLKYCLCSVKDGFSLSLGAISVVSWGVAEVPQIITNYREKSTEGLSIAFLVTWIIGDLFNLFGCLLEPATLPTQYYMAMLYTATTSILTAQTIYYAHIYQRLKSNKWWSKASIPDQTTEGRKISLGYSEPGSQAEDTDICRNGSNGFDKRNNLSSPIPFPVHHRSGSPGRELYYV